MHLQGLQTVGSMMRPPDHSHILLRNLHLLHKAVKNVGCSVCASHWHTTCWNLPCMVEELL